MNSKICKSKKKELMEISALEYSQSTMSSPKNMKSSPLLNAKRKRSFIDEENKWPIYLGTFIYEDNYNRYNFSDFKEKEIDFGTSDLKGNRRGYFSNCMSYIKCDEISIPIQHLFSEIWHFLISFELVILKPKPLNNRQLKIHVYLTEKALLKNFGVKEFLERDSFQNILSSVDISEKIKKIVVNSATRLCKESIMILFDLLKVKKSFDSQITVKDRIKTFKNRYLRSFNNQHYPKLYSEPPRWDYYESPNLENDFIAKKQFSIFLNRENKFDENSSGSDSDNNVSISKIPTQKKKEFLNYNDSTKFVAYVQPKKMVTNLHEYQRQGLTWLLFRENGISQNEMYKPEIDHQEQYLPTLSSFLEFYELPNGDEIFLNIITGQVYLDMQMNKFCKGGILADEMGLGKTLMTLGLILTPKIKPILEESKELKEIYSQEKIMVAIQKGNEEEEGKRKLNRLKRNSERTNEEEEGKRKLTRLKRNSDINKDEEWSFIRLKGNQNDIQKKRKVILNKESQQTLVVTPLSILNQWKSEIHTHTRKNSLKVGVYYGNSKTNFPFANYDVILTTYHVLKDEFKKFNKDQRSKIFTQTWLRVILDEAHSIKNRVSQQSQACFALKAENRWCLTGTPIQNNLDDLYSLLKFLKVEIFGEDYIWWNTYVNKSTEKEKILKNVIGPILLRRTKEDLIDVKSLALPGKSLEVIKVVMTNEERKIYDHLYQQSKDKFHTLLKHGVALKNYSGVFGMLMHLRRCCDHPSFALTERDNTLLESHLKEFLLKKGHDEDSNDESEEEKKDPFDGKEFFEDVIKKIRNEEFADCPVCFSDINEPALSRCCHIMCYECFRKVVELNDSCPICRKPLDINDICKIFDRLGFFAILIYVI